MHVIPLLPLEALLCNVNFRLLMLLRLLEFAMIPDCMFSL
jgi:hypothetical protein